MAEFIDISDFGGVVTNVDVEDLPEHIAQNMENLRIRDGKLEKTFGAGQPSDIPTFLLNDLNTKLSSSYVVYNVFTFISDKLGAIEHRYILVLIDSSTKQVKLFWYDPTIVISEHLQIESNILYFTTAEDQGYSQGDNVMITGAKDNSNVDISNTEYVDDITEKSGNKHFINTDQAKAWGGSLFSNTVGDGLRATTFGGKHNTHLAMDTDASVNDSNTGVGSFTNIALLAQSGEVLCMYSHNIGSDGRIRYTIGGTKAELNTTLYNTWKAYSTFKVNAMEQFGDGIYVYYSAEGTGAYKINAVVKYTLGTNNTIVETGIHGHSPTNHPSTYWGSTPVASDPASSTYSFGRFHVTNSDKLFLLVPGNDTHLYEVTTTVTAVANVPTLSSGYSWADITSITTNSGSTYEFVVIGETTSANHKFHFYNTANGNWTSGTTIYDFQLHHMSKMDFGENSGNHESIVVNLEKVGSGDQFIRYSTHSNNPIGITGFPDINTSSFPASTVVMQLRHAYNSPSGAKYLFVCTNDSSVSPLQHGRVFKVDESKNVGQTTINNPNTDKGWNPTCIDDVATGTANNNKFYTHAKAYIVAYGVVYNTSTSSGALPKGSLNRMTDIGWASGTWAGNGTVDIGWTDLNIKYSIGTQYHKNQRNPIIPFSDSIRVLPGNIATVGSNVTNGLWLGYIDRKLMNDGVTISAGFYAYSNVLTNPFTVSDEMSFAETEDEIRDSDEIRYNVTAVFDGTQETLLEESKEQVAISVAGSGASDFDVVDISKSKIVIPIDINFATLNKRITGLNLYRANRYNGVWETYKKIQEFNFVTEADTAPSGDKFMEMEYYTDKTVYVYDANGYFTSSQITAIQNDYSGYALKVGGNWKRAFTNITKIEGYPLSGAELNSAITADATTGVSVTNASSLANGDYYLGLEIHPSLGATAIGAERVTVSNINTSANTVTLTRAQSSTTATAHPQYTEFRPITATDTGWFKIKVNKKFTATRWNNSWSVYRKLGGSWDRENDTGGGSISSVHSSGAYGAHKAGVMIPSASPDSSEENLDFSSWRDSSSHSITTTGLAGKYIETDENGLFKIEDVNSFNEHAGFFHFKANKNLPAGNGDDNAQLGGTININNTSAQNYTIKITDDGLTSLGEHWGEAVVSTRVNGRYAKMIKSRLFLGNIFLDIGDENEERNDWIAYSEVNQFDTRPVSNVIQLDDREGGAITGLAEIFGRLVIFKPQAIFILNISDPVNPSSWSIVESKHNIGNIAPEGVVEVHDSIYFVYHDGIYRIASNMVASSTATPSVMDKVSDKIDDQYLLATDKTAIKGIYDPSRQEIIYKWMEGSDQRVWAYNYVRESWRKIDMGTGLLDILAYDENGTPLDYDKTSNKIIKFDTANASVAKWKSKRFPLDLHRKRLLRYGTVQFTGSDNLTYNIYLDGATSASFTKTITADGGINRFPIKRYAKKFEVEIATASSTNALTLERLQIEME